MKILTGKIMKNIQEFLVNIAALVLTIDLSIPVNTLDVFDYDSKPFFAHSFKLKMSPYQEECVWQKVKAGSYLSFGYEVMRGGDRKVRFALRDIYGRVLQSEPENEELFLERNVEDEGVLGFCMDNQDGKFTEKLLFFYLSGYVAHQWEISEEESQQYDIAASNITSALSTVDAKIQKMLNEQTVSRMHLVTDWYLISGNLKWVTYWSGFQSFIIAVVGFIQVFFIKRMFADSSTGGSTLLRERA